MATEPDRAGVERSLQPPNIPGDELILTLHEPVLVLDAELRVRIANPSFQLEFGLSADALVGGSVYGMGKGAWGTAEV